MKQAFLICAHKDMDQLNGLVRQLCDPDFCVYVHLDRKSALDPARLHPAARLVRERVAVRWGDVSQVESTLASMRQILLDVPDFDKLILLSAQDFPLLPNHMLKAALARMRGYEMIETAPIAAHGWRVMHRYAYFHRDSGRLAERLACAVANRALRLLRRTRHLPDGFVPYGGSCWWTLSRGCVRELLRLADAHPRLLRFCRSVQSPDELFFQTLVMHSRFAGRVLPDNLRYIAWPDGGSCNPRVLDEDDFERIKASGAHFCRKLDSQASAVLLSRLLAWKEGRLA
ncbi:beta-1,6-N-acetylglucosaminyltransferase [Massilia sp. CFBP9012]|uniref:beta-1,6-N-acetylglucosaminyltransferase n=1 Tax=Massilia sp. CFBP9012 TaxID=3096531 RepID=UPI002A6A1E8B|nr:beta-1,6-N-acetylglucosaminyltransferase [Massilia sp. CFBP9012]MDY0976367.1 beta-1,6-N-acetylglucosaminyltransferase [Massilia sp. CFBP9012]